ncbi:MAG: nucleotidyltransferase family protein [Ruminococcaceae bacterium]|nr:nucleotidyltransferase family protein [Oscillospiraceae bacterium]
MRICGVIAEYNPFHNGHKYQIEKIKENGFDGVVAVMSGNAVQRGEFAFLDKSVRTRQALLNGVDLVIELPLPFSVSSAEKFALGGTSILDSLGVVNALCFSSECAEIEKLKRIAEINSDSITDYLKSGVTYASAYENLVENELGKEFSSILQQPNNVLGIEYLKALKRLNSEIKPFTIKRTGVKHNDEKTEKNFCSAKYIRENFDKKDVSSYMPFSSFELLEEAVKNNDEFSSLEKNEKTVLSMLRMFDKDYFSTITDISEGIENRLYSAVKEACSLCELYSSVKTKRYTLARVKRLVFNSLLGVTEEYTEFLPPYIRVLGFNEKGREILRNAKKLSSKPIYTLFSDFNNADEQSKMLYSLECKATDLYYSFTPEIKPCSREQTRNAVIIK